MMFHWRQIYFGGLLLLVTQALTADDELTAAESSSFKSTSDNVLVTRLLQQAARRSSSIRYFRVGRSKQGRAISAVFLSSNHQSIVESAAADVTRVLVQSSIHADEVAGKEALLQLVRRWSQQGIDGSLPKVDLVVLPVVNVDGNANISPDNHPYQNGPVNGMGTRDNAAELDLNRDAMNLATPELRGWIDLINTFDPHVVVDLHTTNGTTHGYHLTYAPPLHPDTPTEIVNLLKQHWFPELSREIKNQTSWDIGYYGNLTNNNGHQSWTTFDYRPRFVTNYLGLRNRVAILAEAYVYAGYAQRIEVLKTFVTLVLKAASEQSDKIIQLINMLDKQSVVGRALTLSAELTRKQIPIKVLLGKVELVDNPVGNYPLRRRLEHQSVVSVLDKTSFDAQTTSIAPIEYVITTPDEVIINQLRRHKIEYQSVNQTYKQHLSIFRLSDVSSLPRYQQTIPLKVKGTWKSQLVDIPLSAIRIPMNQPNARLAFSLLEPLAADGMVAWNIFKPTLQENTDYPVYRLEAKPH